MKLACYKMLQIHRTGHLATSKIKTGRISNQFESLAIKPYGMFTCGKMVKNLAGHWRIKTIRTWIFSAIKCDKSDWFYSQIVTVSKRKKSDAKEHFLKARKETELNHKRYVHLVKETKLHVVRTAVNILQFCLHYPHKWIWRKKWTTNKTNISIPNSVISKHRSSLGCGIAWLESLKPKQFSIDLFCMQYPKVTSLAFRLLVVSWSAKYCEISCLRSAGSTGFPTGTNYGSEINFHYWP